MSGATSEKRSADSAGTAPVLSDRFVLEARLAQGRLGTMYRAFDRLRGQDGRPHVAVLILPADISRSRDQLAIFEHELETVRALSHPNIVRIFSLERDGDTTFLVLEWVDGESLRSVLESLAPETVCEADALGVVRAVGNALVYAHARGVVHGDIRPENVLVTEHGEVRLLFASACLARSSPFTVTPRDDVRGLAALAYELMSGSPPPISGSNSRDKGLEPRPIEALSRNRWKALKAAMAPRDGKVSSIRRLLAALDLPEPKAPRHGARPDRVRHAKGGTLKRIVMGSIVGAVLAAVSLFAFKFLSDSERLEQARGAVTSLWSERRETAASPVQGVEPVSGAVGVGTRATATVRETIPVETETDRADIASVETPPLASVESTVTVPDLLAPEVRLEERVAEDSPPEPTDTGPTDASTDTGATDAGEPADAGQRTASVASGSARVVFSQREYVFSESDGVAAIEVRRASPQGDVSFVWWTRAGTARSGDDYADLGRTVERLPDGETSATLYVPITSDSIIEEVREYFEVHLGVLSSEGNQTGELQTVRVTIVDDDG